jgi:arginine/ornithine N-succinyltransferase beta subunit
LQVVQREHYPNGNLPSTIISGILAKSFAMSMAATHQSTSTRANGDNFEGGPTVLPIQARMDLINAIVMSQQQQLDAQVQFAAARKILDAQRQEGSAVTQLLNAASQTGEKAVDTLALAATGLGGSVDTYA